MKAARKVVSTSVERSSRAYGIIYSSLPEELCAQVAHIPQGWAFGLWDWLEKKFQSTERDSVGILLGQWTLLRQEGDESFDAYRARVNKVATLLENAKQKQTGSMYAHIPLDKLQPRYKQAVLALKAGGQLKDADKVSWDTVTAFINAHERSEQRLGGDYLLDAGADGVTLDGKAMAARDDMSYSRAATARARPADGDRYGRGDGRGDDRGGGRGDGRGDRRGDGRDHPRTLADVQCFNCGQFGHMSRHCTAPRKDRRTPTHADRTAQSSSTSSGSGDVVSATA